ncbi:hypothetical protein LZ31DRAFT_287729 [Colletotrichum somersetense]|nr:hypothetical protein LZ31DRAFT_287729 [Colletotrichum somersetense]
MRSASASAPTDDDGLCLMFASLGEEQLQGLMGAREEGLYRPISSSPIARPPHGFLGKQTASVVIVMFSFPLFCFFLGEFLISHDSQRKRKSLISLWKSHIVSNGSIGLVVKGHEGRSGGGGGGMNETI